MRVAHYIVIGAVLVGATACAKILGIADVPSADASDGASAADGGTCEAHLASDSSNCGRCGHDCLGGACKGGVCQPVTLATTASLGSGRVFAGSLMVDGADHLVWQDGLQAGDGEVSSSAFTIRTCMLPACSAPQVLAIDAGSRYGGVGDEGYFDVFDNDEIYRCTLPGCANFRSFVPGLNAGDRVSLDSIDPTSKSMLFEVVSGGRTQLRYCALPDCPGPSLIDTQPDGLNFLFAVTDGANAYFRRAGGGVTRCPVSGCDVDGGTSIDETMRDPFVLAHGRLFGTLGKAIASCTLPDCADRTSVVETSNVASELVTDESFVYWLDDTNVLFRCSLAGCKQPEVVFTGTRPAECNLCSSKALLRDSKSLVWSNWDAIYRLALP